MSRLGHNKRKVWQVLSVFEEQLGKRIPCWPASSFNSPAIAEHNKLSGELHLLVNTFATQRVWMSTWPGSEGMCTWSSPPWATSCSICMRDGGWRTLPEDPVQPKRIIVTQTQNFWITRQRLVESMSKLQSRSGQNSHVRGACSECWLLYGPQRVARFIFNWTNSWITCLQLIHNQFSTCARDMHRIHDIKYNYTLWQHSYIFMCVS